MTDEEWLKAIQYWYNELLVAEATNASPAAVAEIEMRIASLLRDDDKKE